ncbi:hypothetical protein V6N11_035466 [Hibiscus sabdariffa]|uniref:Uncharacterized protein n=1 Tax=Hibiscus sabdariffa TaxID=183260 RepID=A0ABR2R0P5_9ROSI
MQAPTSSEGWVVDSGATHHVTPDANKVMNGSDYTGPDKSSSTGNSCAPALQASSTFPVMPRVSQVMNQRRAQIESEVSQNTSTSMHPVASDNSLQSVGLPDDTGNFGTSSPDDDVMDMGLQFSNTEDGQVPERTDTVDISPIMEAPETELNAGDGGRDDHIGSQVFEAWKYQ